MRSMHILTVHAKIRSLQTQKQKQTKTQMCMHSRTLATAMLRLCGADGATHYLSLSLKEEVVLCSVCLLSSEARERGSARDRGGATPRESGGGCWEQLRS